MPLKGTFVTPSDLTLVSGQMGGRRFDPSGVVQIAVRCPWGVPQVLKCAPFRGWWPFPTTFWLSCPWLIKAAGALESENGVSRLEDFLRGDRSAWIDYQMSHGVLRVSMIPEARRSFMRKYRRPLWDVLRKGGIGGIDYGRSEDLSVKCLHLQIASWLALGHHPGGSWLRENLPETHCHDRRCLCRVGSW